MSILTWKSWSWSWSGIPIQTRWNSIHMSSKSISTAILLGLLFVSWLKSFELLLFTETFQLLWGRLNPSCSFVPPKIDAWLGTGINELKKKKLSPSFKRKSKTILSKQSSLATKEKNKTKQNKSEQNKTRQIYHPLHIANCVLFGQDGDKNKAEFLRRSFADTIKICSSYDAHLDRIFDTAAHTV